MLSAKVEVPKGYMYQTAIAFADYVIVLAVQVLLYGMDTAVLVAVGVLGYAILTNYANMSS